jgi:hypothetical protein
MSTTPKREHQFTSSWRWPDTFESWVESMTSGFTVNVCAGLSTIGDVRVDLMSPPEIIGRLQDDDKTSLSDAREVCSDLLGGQYIGRDVIQELYESSAPTTHELADRIDTSGCLRADIFDDNQLPIDDNTADWTICDPPWKSLPEESRQRLFDELTRITDAGGHILFNAWWVPTSEYTTLDQIRLRRDDERYGTGTPNVSYASIHTVHPSPHTARYLSQTFTSREHAPEPSSLKETIEAETAYRLEEIDDIDHTEYDIRAVGPDTSQRCPHCGCSQLSPAAGGTALSDTGFEKLYQCPSCEYPVPQHELDAIAQGDIHRVRNEHGWSDIHPSEIEQADTGDPPEPLRKRLESEPGIEEGDGDVYLNYATSG